MKIKAEKDIQFAPVKVTITLESQDEVNSLFLVGDWNVSVAQAIADEQSGSQYTHLPVINQEVAQNVYIKLHEALMEYAE